MTFFIKATRLNEGSFNSPVIIDVGPNFGGHDIYNYSAQVGGGSSHYFFKNLTPQRRYKLTIGDLKSSQMHIISYTCSSKDKSIKEIVKHTLDPETNEYSIIFSHSKDDSVVFEVYNPIKRDRGELFTFSLQKERESEGAPEAPVRLATDTDLKLADQEFTHKGQVGRQEASYYLFEGLNLSGLYTVSLKNLEETAYLSVFGYYNGKTYPIYQASYGNRDFQNITFYPPSSILVKIESEDSDLGTLFDLSLHKGYRH